MDETEATEFTPVGEQLRAAREQKGLSLEEVASETRIPLRHLESLESGDWSRLPAPTYTIGFAKSYASAVGLDRTDIGDQLRVEMGAQPIDRGPAEVFEPADPARTMPRWLVLSAIGAVVVLVILFSWFHNQSLNGPAEIPAGAQADQRLAQAPATPQPQPRQAPRAQGPVVLTATAPAWIRVTDQGERLFEGMLQPGQTYQVPQTATAPLLRAGAPDALRITVGNAVAPPIGPAGQVASDVSLLGPDLMKTGAAGAAAPQNSAAQPQNRVAG